VLARPRTNGYTPDYPSRPVFADVSETRAAPKEYLVMKHEPFIRTAIELAIASGKKGNDAFGAVLVHENKVIATAENTQATGQGFGHAEYNLAVQAAQQFPESVLRESTFYCSAAPCSRCAFSILAIGVRRIAICVGYEAFATLIPGPFHVLSIHEIVQRLELTDVEIVGPILEKEGMRAFEYWGGEYHPLEELLEFARREREKTG
jgi:tRNA(Arg) A34 adenosine deaminase TadA